MSNLKHFLVRRLARYSLLVVNIPLAIAILKLLISISEPFSGIGFSMYIFGNMLGYLAIFAIIFGPFIDVLIIIALLCGLQTYLYQAWQGRRQSNSNAMAKGGIMSFCILLAPFGLIFIVSEQAMNWFVPLKILGMMLLWSLPIALFLMFLDSFIEDAGSLDKVKRIAQ